MPLENRSPKSSEVEEFTTVVAESEPVADVRDVAGEVNTRPFDPVDCTPNLATCPSDVCDNDDTRMIVGRWVAEVGLVRS